MIGPLILKWISYNFYLKIPVSFSERSFEFILAIISWIHFAPVLSILQYLSDNLSKHSMVLNPKVKNFKPLLPKNMI